MDGECARDMIWLLEFMERKRRKRGKMVREGTGEKAT
jgi:hypothetical protein